MLTEVKQYSKSGAMEALLIRKEKMKLKIYQEKGHHYPHILIDYGKQNHVASYSIETGQRLEGNLPKSFDRVVTSWLERNRSKVLEVWAALQLGEPHEHLIAELSGDA